MRAHLLSCGEVWRDSHSSVYSSMRTPIEYEAASHLAVCGHIGRWTLRNAEVYIVAQIELYFFFLEAYGGVCGDEKRYSEILPISEFLV